MNTNTETLLTKMENEDPFAFLLENSKPSLSQEEQLRNCPFAREHDPFMDSDTQSTWASSQPTGIIMESLPETDPTDGKDVVQEDEKFLTPPEHHFYSVSDSDDPEFAPTEANSQLIIGGGGFEEVGGGDFGEEGNVVSGIEVGKVDLEGKGCDCVIKDNESEYCGEEFDEDVSRGEVVSNEVTVETLEVSVETDCVMETPKVDTEEICLPSEEMVVCCEDYDTKVADDLEVQTKVDLEGKIEAQEYYYLVCNTEVGKVALEGKGCDCVVKDHELEYCGDEFDEDVSRGKAVSNEVNVETLEVPVETDCVMETPKVDTEEICLPSKKVVVCCEDYETEVADDKEVQTKVDLEENLEARECYNVVHNTETDVVLSEFDNNGVLDEEIMSKKCVVSEELDLGGGTGCVENMHQHLENINTEVILDQEEQAEEITLDANLTKKDHHEGDTVSKRKVWDAIVGDNGGLNVLSNGENELVKVDRVVEVREDGRNKYCEGINLTENGEHTETVGSQVSGKRRRLQGSYKIKSGKSKEDIEKFKYVKPTVCPDQRGENERVSQEGDVPLFEVGHGGVHKGYNSFLKLVHKASEVLKHEVDPDHEVDLLEILKKKGITFPLFRGGSHLRDFDR